MAVTLDIWSDLVCPWCFIGRRRLASALAEEPAGSVHVRWHAFQLSPELPPEGVEAAQYYAAKFGSLERANALRANVADVAAGEGLAFRLDLQTRSPNSLLAHRAVKLAPDPDAAMDAIFSAHFEQGLDIGDRETLLRLVPGLDGAALDRGDGSDAVAEDLEVAARIGVTGVPFFVAGARYGLSGAQEPALLRELVAKAREGGRAAA